MSLVKRDTVNPVHLKHVMARGNYDELQARRLIEHQNALTNDLIQKIELLKKCSNPVAIPNFLVWLIVDKDHGWRSYVTDTHIGNYEDGDEAKNVDDLIHMLDNPKHFQEKDWHAIKDIFDAEFHAARKEWEEDRSIGLPLSWHECAKQEIGSLTALVMLGNLEVLDEIVETSYERFHHGSSASQKQAMISKIVEILGASS